MKRPCRRRGTPGSLPFADDDRPTLDRQLLAGGHLSIVFGAGSSLGKRSAKSSSVGVWLLGLLLLGGAAVWTWWWRTAANESLALPGGEYGEGDRGAVGQRAVGQDARGGLTDANAGDPGALVAAGARSSRRESVDRLPRDAWEHTHAFRDLLAIARYRREEVDVPAELTGARYARLLDLHSEYDTVVQDLSSRFSRRLRNRFEDAFVELERLGWKADRSWYDRHELPLPVRIQGPGAMRGADSEIELPECGYRLDVEVARVRKRAGPLLGKMTVLTDGLELLYLVPGTDDPILDGINAQLDGATAAFHSAAREVLADD